MRLIRLSISIIVLAAILPYCAAAEERAEADGISLQPVTGWSVITNGLPKGTLLTIVGPAQNDGFTPSMHVLVDPAGAGETAQTFLERKRNEVERSGGRVESSGAVTINGIVGARMIVSRRLNAYIVKSHDTLLVSDGKLYIITGTCLAAMYPSCEAAFTAMADSVKLK